MTTDEGRKLVEQMKRDTKMGHEALLELVMGQFALMTAEERLWLIDAVGEHYCTYCGNLTPEECTCLIRDPQEF
jgi:hypothetical protein